MVARFCYIFLVQVNPAFCFQGGIERDQWHEMGQ